jgi:hypothetical protein
VDGSRPTDESCPWTEVVRRTEVRGRKSYGRKSNLRWTCRASPPLRRCTAVMQVHAAAARVAQRGGVVVTRVARELRHCFCNSRRGSVATLLLQHQSRERSDAVVASVVATLLQLALLRQCCNRRCNNATALFQLASLRR